MTNRIAYLTGKQKIEIKEAPVQKMLDDSVMVEVEYCGVCGSDVYFYEGGMCGPDVLPFPVILGHECAGKVVEIGKNVSRFKVGDKVCLEPGVPCGKCEFCMSGRYNLCPDVEFMAAPPNYQGALRTYVVHPEHMAFKLPDVLDTLDGALVEPLSVGFHAAEQGGASFGKKVVILGAGCIGFMTMMACQAMGVSDITVVDLFDKRLQKAKELGASRIVNASTDNTVEKCLEINRDGADIVFETAGSPFTTRQTGALVKPGGTIVLVGNTHGEVSYDFFEIMNKEVTVKCVFRYRNLYELVIAAIASGKADPKKIVTSVYGFDETPRAFEESVSNKKDIIKAVIKY